MEFLKTLKARNTPTIWAVLICDAAIILLLFFPSMPNEASFPTVALLRYGLAAIAPVVVFLLTSLLPSDAKAVLVFWRIRDVLPGHRAFSLYAKNEPRIDIEDLRKNVGPFPTSPREENALWYRLFKKVEKEESVWEAHRQFLLFRDLASISFLFLAIVPTALLFGGAAIYVVLSVLGLFAIQLLATSIAARNHGTRLVTNVLALHSVKRRTR